LSEICLKTATVITALLLLRTARAQTPGDVVFELRTARSPALYQIGERIELELSFSAGVSGKYGIVSSSECRDSSLLNETYSISPATGAMDPQESQRAMPWGGGGSFMSGQVALSDVPVIRHADLNEWLRVTRPGHYVLRAVSPRVFSVGEVPQFPDLTAGNHPVTSNEIELTIVGADAAGLADQLAAITAILDSDENPEKKLQAARSLTYLDTPGAAAEMARRPAPQSLSVSSPSPTAFTASGGGWLSITPSGTLTTNQTISVSVNQSANLDNLQVGYNTAAITLSTAAATQYVPVTFTVTAASSQITLEANPNNVNLHLPNRRSHTRGADAASDCQWERKYSGSHHSRREQRR
jgi:hypothetical protein